jgi:small subunit ribosomal protein S9
MNTDDTNKDNELTEEAKQAIELSNESGVEISLAGIKELFGDKTYVEFIGRRKTATARVRIIQSKKVTITVNDKDVAEYFSVPLYRDQVTAPFKKVGLDSGIAVTVVVHGSGISSQAEAVRHGIARALVAIDPLTRSALKKAGFLKRDPRSKERKKPGLKKARKRPAWSKR